MAVSPYTLPKQYMGSRGYRKGTYFWKHAVHKPPYNNERAPLLFPLHLSVAVKFHHTLIYTHIYTLLPLPSPINAWNSNTSPLNHRACSFSQSFRFTNANILQIVLHMRIAEFWKGYLYCICIHK